MSHDDAVLVQHLRSRLMIDEPSGSLSPTAVRVAGQKRLRRRRLLSSVAVVAAVVAVAAGTAVAQGSLNADPDPTPPMHRPADYTPDQVEAAMKAAVMDHQSATDDAPWQVADVVAQASNPGRIMSGDNRVIADQWLATFTAGAGHQLELQMVHASPVDRTDPRSQRADCATTLELGYADHCDVTFQSGSVVKVVQRATYKQGKMWPVLVGNTAPNQGEIPLDQHWFMQQVVNFRPDGLIVTVSEMVHTPNLSDANNQWLESTNSLTAIAADPDLGFTNPTPPYSDQKGVGIGQAVIVVPTNWPVVTDPCFRPDTNHIYWYSDQYAAARCLPSDSPHGVAIGIGTLDSDVGRQLMDLNKDAASGDPDTWIDAGPNCSTDDNYCTEWFALESSNAFISVTVKQSSASKTLGKLRDSLQVLPPTETTVPFISEGATYDQALSAIEQAHLQLATRADEMPPQIGFTFPSMGSVVPADSDVRLLSRRGQ